MDQCPDEFLNNLFHLIATENNVFLDKNILLSTKESKGYINYFRYLWKNRPFGIEDSSTTPTLPNLDQLAFIDDEMSFQSNHNSTKGL